MILPVPTLVHGDLTVRPIRVRDARPLELLLAQNRSWLRQWEATSPTGMPGSVRQSIRNMLAHARDGLGLPFLLEWQGELCGQLSVSGMSYGSLASASIGYWVSESHAGRGITPLAVAMVTDYCFTQLGLHRIEICIRPENGPSLRVVDKLGFRYEGERKRYIHINGDWRDHRCFALVREEVPEGLLARYLSGEHTRL